MPADQNGKWHLDKRVSVGHVFTTLSLVVMFIVYMSKMDVRISVNEANIAHASNQFSKIEMALVRIEDKLDKKEDKP